MDRPDLLTRIICGIILLPLLVFLVLAVAWAGFMGDLIVGNKWKTYKISKLGLKEALANVGHSRY